MIKNDRQYRVTKAAAERIRSAIEKAGASQAPPPGIDPVIQQAQMAAMASQLDDLAAEMAEYEGLVSGDRQAVAVETLADLPRAMIQARIAAGLTQKELGQELGLKEQQIQRYEATDYQHASFARLLEVAAALGVRVTKISLDPRRLHRTGPTSRKRRERVLE